MKNANLLGHANAKAGASRQQHREEGCADAGLPTERGRPLEQELPAASTVQRDLHLDQYTASPLPEPEAHSGESQPSKVS